MLLANYLTAQELILKVGKAAFIRNHRPPKLKGIELAVTQHRIKSVYSGHNIS